LNRNDLETLKNPMALPLILHFRGFFLFEYKLVLAEKGLSAML